MAQTENVTVLFTGLASPADPAPSPTPEAADSMRRALLSELRRAVASSGGSEVKNLGDGIMVVFRSSSTALSCAVAMQQGVDRRDRQDGVASGLRVGLSTGEATHEGDDFFGDPIIEAARLCARAEGGQILATEFVKMMAGRRVAHTLRALGEMELKGLPEPLEVLEVGWDPLVEDDVPTTLVPLPARLSIAPAVGLIGRESQAHLLSNSLKRVTAGDGREVVLISGDPGVGKTALAAHAARLAFDAGACVLLGRCDEDLTVPYGPFVEALHHYVKSAPDEVLASHVRDHGAELARIVPSLGQRLGELPDLQSSDPNTERYLLFSAVLGMLEQISRGQPLVLVLDDLQWADKPSVQLLRHIVASDRGDRVLVIGTYRRSDLSEAHPLTSALVALRREHGVGEVDLIGLDDDAVVAYVEAAAGHELREPGLELAHALYRETEGNPYFVGEVLRHLYETGAIAFEGESGRWAPQGGFENMTLPESVRQVIGSRVARLGEDARRVLSFASVIGREFDLDLLAAVTERSEDSLLDILDDAASSALVREMPESPGRYTFPHALIQHTLYQDLGVTRRARVHRHVAEAIEAGCGGGPAGRVVELAHHWSNATRPVEMAKAVSYGYQAGLAALEALAPDEAIRHFSQAWAFFEDDANQDPLLGVDLLIGLGTAQRQAGIASYRETFLDAAHRAKDLGDTDRLVAAALGNNRGVVSSSRHVDVERISILEAALRALPAGDSRERALLLGTLCAELTLGSSLSHRIELADEAQAIARRLGDDEAFVQVTSLVFPPLSVPWLQERRRRDSRDALDRAESLGDPGLLFRALTGRRFTALKDGDFELGANLLERARQLSDRLREPAFLWLHAVHEATEALMLGDTVEAETRAERALRIGMDTGQPDALAFYGGQLAVARLQQGRLVELVPLLDQVILDNPDNQAFAAVRTIAYLESGDHEVAAERLGIAARDDFAAVPHDLNWLDTLFAHSYVAIELGAAPVAQQLHDLLAPYGSQVVYEHPTCNNGPIAVPLGSLATVLGRYDEAESYFSQGAEITVRGHLKYVEARAELGWGRMLSARGRPGDIEGAREHLGGSRRLATERGYGMTAQRAEAELARLPGS